MARKQPWKGQPTYGVQYIGPGVLDRVLFYPPVDRNLAPLYVSCPKERNQLGFCMLDWTKAQLEKMHQARLKGRQIKPHRYRAGTAVLRDIRHFQKSHSSPHSKAAFPEVGEGDHPGFQDRPVVPVSGYTVFTV